jgi:hypothetical protein
MANLTERWDISAIKQGASVIGTIAVPLAVIGRLAFDEGESSSLASLLAMVTLAMFVIGAGVAAWQQNRGTPLSHGMVTAVGMFIVVQVIFAIIRVLGGNSLNLGRIMVSLTLTALAGLLGGFFGSFLQSRGIRASR